MFQKAFIFAISIAFSVISVSQKPAEQPTSSEILHKLETLNVLGSVLYIAAHPDDENTRLISYLANGAHVRTAYLSLTRGSGGQNLIGDRLGDPLGIIRTNELLEARRVDGGIQFFSRAVDFGYSKTADESFDKWGKNEIMSDMVRVIRHFKPDVIITRFPPNSKAGHGHHQASAILALEAFDLAADPNAFPEQLEQGLSAWKTKRLFWNSSSWWDKSLPDKAENEPNWVTIDVGQYDALLGLSYNELAGRSRSMHKSQGFGSAESKGSQMEYLHLEKGASITRNDLFEDMDLSWTRILGGSGVGQVISQLIHTFEPSSPEQITDALELLHNEMSSLPPSHYRTVKLAELEEFMINITATSMELLAEEYHIPVNSDKAFRFEFFTRAPFPVDLLGVHLPNDSTFKSSPPTLLTNDKTSIEHSFKTGSVIDQPHWLIHPHSTLFDIKNPSLMTKPVVARQLTAKARFKIAGITLERDMPAYYKWVDRVDGERIRPVVVTPIASLTPSQHIVIAKEEQVTIGLEVEAIADSVSGTIQIDLPKGWRTTKDIKTVASLAKGERASYTFVLTKSKNAIEGIAHFSLETDSGIVDKRMHVIDHQHMLPQTYFTPAQVKLVPLDVQVNAQKIGYIPGAGDLIPDALNELGVSVEIIETKSSSLEQLAAYDAIVTGIRAYNTDPELKHFNQVLLQYVEQGGILLVQYNTSRRLMEGIGPYPFNVTRKRITVEEATTNFLQPNDSLLQYPNTIGPADFEGWVQERGLYFTDDQDARYTKLLSWSDPGEKPLDGGLIYCKYGKGRFVYTGISFFRQLPAGVPGAYRLFANLISQPAK